MSLEKKTNKGITLIALVITIIVLLILAGVTIAAVSGDNGILTRAADAKEKTEIADIKEELQRKILEEQITNDGDLTETELETILTSKGTLSDETDILDRTLTTTKGSYEIPVRDIWNGTFTGGASGGGGGSGSGLTDTADTKPGAAMPSGATVIEADPSKGIVIKDSKNNEWVWIEVPKTTVFTSAQSSTDYDNIKANLIAYATDYRKGSASQSFNWSDEWYSGCGIADSGTYTTTYQKMLSSVYTNGGFWIGRYEAGVSNTTPRTEEGEITGLEAKSQPDMYPFNYVTCSQAQTLASAMSTDSNKTSSLMFGIQWDLVCKYLEGKDGLTKADINSDSTNWGNYNNIAVPITSVNAKQSTNYGSSWSAITESKAKNSSIILSTAASNNTKKMNIYDFAGNEWEWTLEHATTYDFDPCAGRGGCYANYGSKYPASGRYSNTTSDSNGSFSFRPSLY